LTILNSAFSDFIWTLKKEGLAEVTIKNYSKSLEALVDNGANLSEPESIKAVLASSSWANSTRSVIAAAYQKYAVLNNIEWLPPKYVQTRKLPFIPLEKEIDEFIACVGRRMSVLLQCLMETGARIGEVLRIKWNDVDSEKKTIAINHPENTAMQES